MTTTKKGWKHRSQGPKAASANSWRIKRKVQPEDVTPEKQAPALRASIDERLTAHQAITEGERD